MAGKGSFFSGAQVVIVCNGIFKMENGTSKIVCAYGRAYEELSDCVKDYVIDICDRHPCADFSIILQLTGDGGPRGSEWICTLVRDSGNSRLFRCS